jgi:hypothetical protein
VAAWLIRQYPAKCNGLSFEYVDREVRPARTTGGVRLTDGRSARQAPSLDLLLEDANERTPVLSEVKGSGRPASLLRAHPAAGARRAGRHGSQRERLLEWYPGRFGDGDGRIDLCMLLAANLDRGTYRPRLLEIADELSGRLLDHNEVALRLRRIACLELRLERPSPRVRAPLRTSAVRACVTEAHCPFGRSARQPSPWPRH